MAAGIFAGFFGVYLSYKKVWGSSDLVRKGFFSIVFCFGFLLFGWVKDWAKKVSFGWCSLFSFFLIIIFLLFLFFFVIVVITRRIFEKL